jgi:hypothetical protein
MAPNANFTVKLAFNAGGFKVKIRLQYPASFPCLGISAAVTGDFYLSERSL